MSAISSCFLLRLQRWLGSSLVLQIPCRCSTIIGYFARSPSSALALAIIWAARIPYIIDATVLMMLSVAIVIDFACEASRAWYFLASSNYVMWLSTCFDLRACVEHTISSVENSSFEFEWAPLYVLKQDRRHFLIDELAKDRLLFGFFSATCHRLLGLADLGREAGDGVLRMVLLVVRV